MPVCYNAKNDASLHKRHVDVPQERATINATGETSSQYGTVEGGVQLKRRVGLLSGVALIVGNMIGSGIFISPGYLLARTGSVSVGLIIWLACGLLSLLGGLAYAELGGVVPKNGGEFVYFLESMGDLHPVLGPLPGFLFIWVTSLLLRPSGQAILTLTFARYLLYPIWHGLTDADLEHPDCDGVDLWSYKLAAAACIGITHPSEYFVSHQLPVGQFMVVHPPVVKCRLVQPPARAVLGLANPQPTKLRCPNNWVTGPQFGGLGIGKAEDCPGWWLDQPALDNRRMSNLDLDG
ncbi:unnamed protein product [Notodromas monacha]|uniref:Uncharacterized protein n=1 Tax=Notodromas monacha TaxID=399045 RepID=A0A7R9BP84_9CRUS|nr:unnamed protein product [Notodromas monacha]CAG0917651.1 unnamed protein product [Notodromas monacha]